MAKVDIEIIDQTEEISIDVTYDGDTITLKPIVSITNGGFDGVVDGGTP